MATRGTSSVPIQMGCHDCSQCKEVRGHIRARYRLPKLLTFSPTFADRQTLPDAEMAVPAEQLLLVSRDGQRLDPDVLIEHVLETEPSRVLVNDEVGIVLFIGGMGVYSLQPTENGDYLAQPVTELSRPRFSNQILRKQIGATVLSVTADAVFIVRDGDILKKVRAERLEPGMVLASGEKVYR
jgi:hypothetical protein